jgi:hypothetical protein
MLVFFLRLSHFGHINFELLAKPPIRKSLKTVAFCDKRVNSRGKKWYNRRKQGVVNWYDDATRKYTDKAA